MVAWHGGAGDGCGGRKGAGSCVVPRTARLAARPAAPLPAPLTLPSRPPARPCQRQNDAHAAGWALEVAEPHCPESAYEGQPSYPVPEQVQDWYPVLPDIFPGGWVGGFSGAGAAAGK